MAAGFSEGDIVYHQILGSEKVVVGLGQNRYLCVRLEDIGPDGRVRSNARVAIHEGNHLKKVGRREGIVAIDLESLYHKEAVARHGITRRWREELLINSLFILAAILIVMALFSGIDAARHALEQKSLEVEENLKAEFGAKIRRELEKQRAETVHTE